MLERVSNGRGVATRGRLRVLYLIESLGRGGAEQSLLNTLRALDRERFEVAVCHLYPAADLGTELSALGVPVWSLGLQTIRDLPSGLPRLASRVRAYRPQILHTHLFAANLLGRLVGRLTRVPAIMTTVHYTDHEPGDWTTYSRKRHLIDFLTVHPGSDRIIAVSEAVARSTRRRLGVRRVVVIPNAVDVARFDPPAASSAQAVRADLGCYSGEVLLLTVGRLHPQKGHRYAILALRRLEELGINARLIVVGEGPLEAELQAFAETQGVADRVRLLGSRDDVPRLLSAADVFVFPSLGEGQGLALVEAMAAGKPCVASNIPAIAEMVTDGQTGLLVPPGDVDALTARLAALCRDPLWRARIGAAARAHVAARYDVGVVAHQLQRVYDATLARRRRPTV